MRAASGPSTRSTVHMHRLGAEQVAVLGDEFRHCGQLRQGPPLDARAGLRQPFDRRLEIRERQPARSHRKRASPARRCEGPRPFRAAPRAPTTPRSAASASTQSSTVWAKGPERVERARERKHAVHREAPGRRLVAHDAIEARGNPHRAAGVGADGERRQPRRDRRRRIPTTSRPATARPLDRVDCAAYRSAD